MVTNLEAKSTLSEELDIVSPLNEFQLNKLDSLLVLVTGRGQPAIQPAKQFVRALLEGCTCMITKRKGHNSQHDVVRWHVVVKQDPQSSVFARAAPQWMDAGEPKEPKEPEEPLGPSSPHKLSNP